MQNPTIAETLLISLVGFLTVFAVLILLMAVIKLISLAFGGKKETAPQPATAPAAAVPAPAPEKDGYTGVKLNGVDDKTAATLMAIVASELEMPLDNLRFISIKEVK